MMEAGLLERLGVDMDNLRATLRRALTDKAEGMHARLMR